MRVDIEYNGKTNIDVGVLLKEFPIITHFNEKYNSTTINGRRGELITNLKSYGNLKISCNFFIDGEYRKTVRKIKRWLSGKGKLVLSDDLDVFYDVVKITYGTETRDYYDRGEFKVTFYCYPYEFEKSGETEIEIDGSGNIVNEFDTCFPLYLVTGGTGTLTVNNHEFEFETNENFYIDIRRKLIYAQYGGNNLCGSTTGDLNLLLLDKGNNSITCSTGKVIVKPFWGYEL